MTRNNELHIHKNNVLHHHVRYAGITILNVHYLCMISDNIFTYT